MLAFDSFVAEIKNFIKDYLPEEYQDAEVTVKEVVKNNDETLTGITIQKVGSIIAPNIYLNSYYDQYQDGRDMEDILMTIAEVREKNEISSFDTDAITNFEVVRDKITVHLINTEANAEYLADKPHTEVEDLSVMYAIKLGQDESGMMSCPITNGLLNNYGITVEELHQIAMDNMAKEDFDFKTMRDVLVEMIGGEDSPFLPPVEDVPSMYVLTNKDKLNGAAAILDSKTMEGISEKLGGDFVIIPSSIHEVIILPLNTVDTDTLNGMVNDVNSSEVAPADVLSNHVYKYDSTAKKVVIAA